MTPKLLLPKEYDFQHHAVCESTMNQGFEWLKDSTRVQDSCLILADQQTAGRGRRGRSWQACEGNAFLSLAFKVPLEVQSFSELSFVSAVALGDTLFQLCSGLKIGYKWPNDILVEDKKVAGILIETEVQKTCRHVVVGMGVNLKEAPTLKDYKTTSIYKETQNLITPLQLAEVLVPQFDRYKNLWLKEGFSKISREWHKHALHLEKEIRIVTDQGAKVGVFEGLDDRGHLALRVAPGDVQSFSTADIVERFI